MQHTAAADKQPIRPDYSGHPPAANPKRGGQPSAPPEESPVDDGRGARKPSPLRSMRCYIILLALVCPLVTTYSRTIINFALVDMIETAPPGQAQATPSGAPNQTQATTLDPPAGDYFDSDGSCPVTDPDVRTRLREQKKESISRARSLSGEKFQWDTLQQGFLKAAYTYGHTPFMIAGGRWAEIWGAHRVLSLAALAIGICCLAAPYLAAANYYLLFADLCLLGVFGSFTMPAMITMFSNWLTPGEKTLTISLCLLANRLGFAVTSLVCGLLMDANLSWRYVFYSAGWVGLIFAAVFFVVARSRPVDHPLVSQLELDYLASKNGLVRESLILKKALELESVATGGGAETIKHQQVAAATTKDEAAAITEAAEAAKAKAKRAAPWGAILTNKAVWAFAVVKICVKFSGDTVQVELPAYLQRVMHYSPAINGYVNAVSYGSFCAGCATVGFLSKYITKRSPFGASKTTIRKVFQCTASFSVTITMIGLGLWVCNDTMTIVLLLTLFFTTTLGLGGEAQIPMDISERYSGTIHAIGATLAISGAIEPTIVGWLLREGPARVDSWRLVWFGAAAVSFVGGMVFLIFGEARVQSFDFIGDEKDEAETKKKKTAQLDSLPPVAALSAADLSNGRGGPHENEAYEKTEIEFIDKRRPSAGQVTFKDNESRLI